MEVPFDASGVRNKGRILPHLLLILGALAGCLAGCHKAPTGQVVATVNGHEITLGELAVEAQSVGVEFNQNDKQSAENLLQRVINRDIMADEAKQQGLDRDPDYFLRRQQNEQILLANLAERKLAGVSTFPTKPEIDRYVASHPYTFAQRQKLTLDQITFPTPAKIEVLKSITQLPTLDASAAKLSELGIRFNRGEAFLDTAALDPRAAAQILALKPGEDFDISTGGQTYLSLITAHASAATSPSGWPEIASNAIRVELLNKAVLEALKKLRDKARIDYNPAFKPGN